MRVLDIGCGDKTECQTIFPNEDITTLDVDPALKPDIVADVTEKLPITKKYDTVFMSHVIEHIPRLEVVPAIRNAAEVLKVGGKIYIITPSLEWAARKILEEENLHVSVLASLFGSQENEWSFHRCGFTMMLLRQAVRMAGLHDMEAYQGSFGIEMDSGIIKAQQNIVVGWKVITDGEET